MGMLYTPGQADALCTVIALGFIISSEGQLKDHSYIIYLDGTDDDAEYRRHRQLEAKLAKLTGMKKLFDPKPQTPGGKSRQPVILAQTNRSVLQGEIMEHEKAIFKILEDTLSYLNSVSGHLDERALKTGPLDPMTQDTYNFYKKSLKKGQEK